MGIHIYGLNIKGIRCRGHLHILYGDLGDDPVVSMNGYIQDLIFDEVMSQQM